MRGIPINRPPAMNHRTLLSWRPHDVVTPFLGAKASGMSSASAMKVNDPPPKRSRKALSADVISPCRARMTTTQLPLTAQTKSCRSMSAFWFRKIACHTGTEGAEGEVNGVEGEYSGDYHHDHDATTPIAVTRSTVPISYKWQDCRILASRRRAIFEFQARVALRGTSVLPRLDRCPFPGRNAHGG